MKLKIGQMIYLQVASIDPEEEKRELKSRVSDIAKDYIGLEIPLDPSTGKYKRLYPGDNLSLTFISEGGVKNYFQTTVVGYLEEQVKQILINKPDPDEITQIQRRNFLRMNARLETAVKIDENIRFIGITEDISGGGISFSCSKQLALQEHQSLSGWILIHYRNGDIEHAAYKGEIVRKKALENGEQLIMVQFTDISDRERQKIIRYCFEKQLNNRKDI